MAVSSRGLAVSPCPACATREQPERKDAKAVPQKEDEPEEATRPSSSADDAEDVLQKGSETGQHE
jgi:uncharacterized Zn finger protein (UPF0148 family)